MKTKVTCPKCHSLFQLDELVLSDFRKSIEKDLETELTRRKDELSKQLERERVDIRNQVQQESLLTIKTKEKLISDLKDQLAKVRQKLENSSVQMIGEIQELELEAILASTFPTDVVEPVAKGVNGADCTVFVRGKNGTEIGSILFESKRVKNFSEGWITKLKKDNRQAKCDITVIVTSTMPKDITGKFGMKDGVWICLFEPDAIKQLTLVLRYGLLKVYQVMKTQEGSNAKADKLYQYLTSSEFRELFESVLKGYKTLEESFQDERKKLTQLWKIREQHLQDMLSNTLEFIGTVRGISDEIPDMLEYRQAS